MRVNDITRHSNSYTCKQGIAWRKHEAKQDEQYEAGLVRFYVEGQEIERVHQFRYLGRIITEDDSDTECIEDNLRKARSQWNSVARILKREGANSRCMAKFYTCVVQAVLLYGAESWTVSQRDKGKLQSFHRRAVRYITGTHIRRTGDDEWEYPRHEELLRQCGLHPIGTYLEK